MGHIQRRAKDRWRARYLDPDGTERSKTFPRKLDAERFLVSVETDKLRGLYLDPSLGRVGFATYAIGWLEAQPVRPGTRHVYDSYLRNWILPALKGRALAAIRPTEIRGLIKKADAGLAPVTVRGIHNLLSTIFASAVADGYIAKNPCVATAPPKPLRARVVPLEVAHVEALMNSIQPRCRPMVALGAGCGLRLGEVLGLRLHRVHFLARELEVAEQVVLNPGSPPTLAPPKTRRSVRTVPLPSVVASELAAYLEVYPVRDKDGLLFRSRYETPLWSSWFYEWVWRPAVIAADLPPGTRFHELRHFYASALIRSGESVKTVQAALGHATAVETLETYASLWPDAPERTRAAVDALFGPAMGDRKQPGLHAADGL